MADIISDAYQLHRGVYCSHKKLVPSANTWHEEDAIAKGAVLLASTVNALGAVFHMLVETIKYLQTERNVDNEGLWGPQAMVSNSAKEASRNLELARDQLIRGADMKDKNDSIGPVLTPEAIAIALIERLTLGVFESVTIDKKIDIINMYEECLEALALQVKTEASRRLLQKINELQEEVTIVNDVFKQQVNVLLKFRECLDPKTFGMASITRRLRYEYECKGIDRILDCIRERLRSCAELKERAKLLAIENVQLVETLQDDNSKAIFIFTVVTVMFLPLSFVAGFFGMNVVGISGTTSTVRHFWVISLPLTFGIIIMCAVIGLKGEDAYFASTRIWRKISRLNSDHE